MNNQAHLTDEEFKRYDRHIKLSGFGLSKQLQLKKSRVFIVGAGGLGCPVGLYLAAAGIGCIGIADDDIVDISNLQRQIAFSVDDIGESKTKILCKKLTALNPTLNIIGHCLRIDSTNAETIIRDYDLVIDGSDNFETRFLLADACFFNNAAYLHASVYQYQGQISLFPSNSSPCFRCLYRQPPDSALPACGEAGILGVVTGTVGLLAATEAVKYLLMLGDSIAQQVLIYNALTQESKKISIAADENCPLCSKNATITKITNTGNTRNCQSSQGILSMHEMTDEAVTLQQAAEWIKTDKKLYLMDVREFSEYEQGHIEGSTLIPLSTLKTMSDPNGEKATYLSQLPADKTQKILCYCRKGGRSLQATHILRQAGFANTFSMDGGFEAWQDNQT